MDLNLELIKILDESLVTVNKLLSLMKTDHDHMQRCINGDILKEYQKVSDEAIEVVNGIQNTLIVLQDRQKSGM